MFNRSKNVHITTNPPLLGIGLQISEGTNWVGIVRWIWAFAYVLLALVALRGIY